MFIFYLLFLGGCGASSIKNYTLSRNPRAAPSFNDPNGVFLRNHFFRGNYDVTFYIRQIENQCQNRELYKAVGTPFGEIKVRNLIQQFSIDKSRKLVVLIHGFNSNIDEKFPSNMADALCWRNTNVILVDWRKLAAGANQPLLPQNFQAAANYVTTAAGIVTHFLLEMTHLDPKNTHFIGHSLGSYVSCYAARLYHLIFKDHQIDRITMLDPPTIIGIGTSLVVELSDASYIDTIQTSFVTSGFRLGHVDFYINPSFWTQPGCWLRLIIGDIFCSHSFVYEVYLETITTGRSFSAKRCPCFEKRCDLSRCQCGWRVNGYIGYNMEWPNPAFVTKEDVKGFYIFTTNKQAPYTKDNCPSWYWSPIA